jgi:hypothetical protein
MKNGLRRCIASARFFILYSSFFIYKIMQVDIKWMETWFDRFNHDYFDGGLPRPRFALSKSRTRLGSMACKRRLKMGRIQYYDYSIHISNYYDQSERQFQNVMLHEMIHYSIAYTGLKDTSSHGDVFRGMMDSLNRKYGWGITVMSSTRNVKVSEDMKPDPNKERLVLALEMADGKRFLSVVNPHFARRLNAELKRVPQIKKASWHISTDACFAHYPVVRSMRGRRVERDVYDEKVREMKQITF